MRPSRARRQLQERNHHETAGVSLDTDSTDDSVQRSEFSEMPIRLMRFSELRRRTGLSRSTIWRLERAGEFPRHFQISRNAVAWLESDVVAWIGARTVEGQAERGSQAGCAGRRMDRAVAAVRTVARE